ncbi:ribose transport system substrate-binding protein [Marisediminicola sp. UYEF4]|uniref:sugar ABC transporter substrate-binding protein n=1 Tax=Marisediminicola sp. UYEF4 TaxID=1756384 RepID=UPI003396B7D7
MKSLTTTNSRRAAPFGAAATFASLAIILAGCSGAASPPGDDTSSGDDAAAVTSCTVGDAPFSTDDAEDSIDYTDLEGELGAVPDPADGTTIGSIMKFLGNQYWLALSEGQSAAAELYGVSVDVQAAASESDQVGQLNSAETMLQNDYAALLVSPQTDTNLCPAVEQGEGDDVLVVNVNDAVLPGAKQWVGPNQIQNGISAAEFVLANADEGAQVAIIEGQAGVYAAVQRTAGFTETAEAGGLEVVASVPGDWDIAKARDAAATIIQQYPDIAAIYANNDGMALGVAEAVNSAGLKGKVMVIGTDGVEDAYNAIRAGDLTATIDSFPYLTGQVSVNVALRVLGGQDVPRAVYTPQALITEENVDDAPPTLD